MVADFDKPSGKVLSPTKLAHVVLRTNNFANMVEYYKTFLGAEVIYKNDFLAFLTYDEEHHRLAIAEVPGTKGKVVESSGLEHIAFSFASLQDLLLTYRQRKAKGISPLWHVNHGPTTSIYYRDPDGNMIEIQVDNFESPDEATDFMNSANFAENPIGTDFDPEDMILKLKSGVSESELKRRIEIGPRGLPSLA